MIFIKTGAAEATTNWKNDQNNDNNNSAGNGANAFNNNKNMNTNDQATVPNGNKPESATFSSKGNNELMYDIDIRFAGSNDKRTNENPLNKV